MADEKTKRRHGCLFYGGLTGTICLVAILLAALIGLRQVKKMVADYTESGPTPMPRTTLSSAQIEQVQRRVEVFQDTLRANRPAPPLVLTGEEINALIATRPDLRGLQDKLHVTLQDGQAGGTISLPMSELGLPAFAGRYLNGTATFSISLQQGKLWVAPENILVKGKPLPSLYMNKIRRQNLAAKAADNPRVSIALDRLQDIQVKNGTLVIVPKSGP